MVELIGIILFIALIITDIVRIFKDNEEFDGIMLFARPVVAFVGTLLCGGTFWTALLCAVGWGVVGFVVSALISEHFSVHSNDITSSSNTKESHNSPVDTDAEIADIVIIELVNIIVNKIAYRYSGGIHLFVSDCYTKIEFYDFNDSYSQDFRAVVHQGTCSFGYSWALKYYGDLTEAEAVILRNFGHINHLGNWEIELRSRNSGQSTIAKVNRILKSPPDTVNVEISSGTDATKCSAHLQPAKNQPQLNNQPVSTPPITKTQTEAPTSDSQDKGYTSIQLKDTGDGFEICQTHYVETEGVSTFFIDYADGRIFIDWKDGSPQKIIGYYEQSADPVYLAKVFDASKQRVIGRVGNELIYFRSREADPASGRYSPDEECLAYYTKNGSITALGSLPFMGHIRGSELGGAAAFVAVFNAYNFKGVYRDYFEMDPDSFKEKHHKYLHPMGW